jgi:hypothetical protein
MSTPQQIELFTPENTIGDIRLYDVESWDKAQRDAVAIWLRAAADKLDNKNCTWSKLFRLMYFK